MPSSPVAGTFSERAWRREGGGGGEGWALQRPSRRAHQRKHKKPAVTSVGAWGTRNSEATKLCDVIYVVWQSISSPTFKNEGSPSDPA